MGKRVLLFLATNLAIVLTLSVIMSILGVGRAVGPGGMTALAVICFVWGMGGALISLLISRWMAKITMGVKLIDGKTGHNDLDWLHNSVANLTRQRQLPMPEVGVYESQEVNAFATGPSKRRSLVAVSTGLLSGMSRQEIEGVLAHEVSHIANGDMVTMTLLQGVINAFVMFVARLAAWAVGQFIARDEEGDSPLARGVSFAVMILLEIVLGVLGSMVTASFSRRREFRADTGAAALAGREAMVAALRQLLRTHERVDTRQAALASFKIAGGRNWVRLFATHPPLEERIAALERTTL
jgi:heat shock protein HtpX